MFELNAGANNYLGLSNNAEVVKAAKQALDTHGFGLSSVRFICGTQVRARLERRIECLHGVKLALMWLNVILSVLGFLNWNSER